MAIYKNKTSHSASLYVPGENIPKEHINKHGKLCIYNSTMILFLCLVLFALIFSLTACAPATQASTNVENDEVMVVGNMVEIGRNLYYDSSTNIVYFWNGVLGYATRATTPTAYYAPNGLPYKYNPETNTFEEIGE